jgi:Domain of unknown function (DUF4115)
MEEQSTGGRTTLEELEHFQQQIRHYKAQREAVGQEFERFVRSFTTPEKAAPTPTPERSAVPPIRSIEPPPPVAHVPVAPAPVAPAPVTLTPVAPAPPAPASPISIEPHHPAAEPVARPSRDGVPAPPVRRQSGARTGVLIGGTLAVLAGGALVTWTLRSRSPESPATGTTAPIAPPAVPVAREPSPPTVAAAESELTTTRAVWVRVFADGERVLERELPPDVRVPLKADKTIVIRTGDAGAIRLTVRGQDQGVLGRTGEVVTRTFNVPPPPAAR